MAEREWSKMGVRREVYFDRASGEILGAISFNLVSGTYSASLAAQGLGEYVNEASAKRIVENTVATNEARAKSSAEAIRADKSKQ